MILILDFGSQYTQLIARRIRENNVYSVIKPYTLSLKEVIELNPAGIILSGGPADVLANNAPMINRCIFELDIPVLGICYGMHLITHLFNGDVITNKHREYGKIKLRFNKANDDYSLFNEWDSTTITQGWASHSNTIVKCPPSFNILAYTPNYEKDPKSILIPPEIIAAIVHKNKKIYGLSFHPEVYHTQWGDKILANFVRICSCEQSWSMGDYSTILIKSIKEKVGSNIVICAVSGGVDSTVTAILLHKAIGKQVTCIFVDNGLLRKDEANKVQVALTKVGINLIVIKAQKQFLSKLKGIKNPEKKRKIIGHEFIRVFEQAANNIKGNVKFLAQGTLYPDVIESVPVKGPSSIIKSHHNVGGLPEKMSLKLIEPLRELFKDEVRKLGKELGVPDNLLTRHPFPGPGLGIRCLGIITKEKLNILQEADAILIEEIQKAGWYDKIWQCFAVLPSTKSVGVMGDKRTYDYSIVIRAVDSVDGMTADWIKLPYELLEKISNRIVNEVKGVNRVTYDVTSKPPGTIEWE